MKSPRRTFRMPSVQAGGNGRITMPIPARGMPKTLLGRIWGGVLTERVTDFAHSASLLAISAAELSLPVTSTSFPAYASAFLNFEE